jgi:hypothetical protein
MDTDKINALRVEMEELLQKLVQTKGADAKALIGRIEAIHNEFGRYLGLSEAELAEASRRNAEKADAMMHTEEPRH